MSLPPFLLVQIRSAFQTCARRRTPITHRTLNSTAAYFKRATPTKASGPTAGTSNVGEVEKYPQPVPTTTSQKRQLVRQEDEQRRLSKEYRRNLPIKIIPKANIAPNVDLTPQQRLHIETITRRPPQERREKQLYKEKLLIYHLGTGREKCLIFLKFVAIFSAGFVFAIVAPAHYHAGTSPWLILLFVAGGLLPISAIHALTRSWVTRIFLHLPTHARQTPKAAMEFARNLPANARLDIEYLRPVPLANKITANIIDLAPIRQKWKLATFQWIGPRAEMGTFWRPNVTRFYVRPQSAKGKASRFTVPGIWSNVYHRLTGVESVAVSKWKR